MLGRVSCIALGGMATVAVRARVDIAAGTSLRLRYGELSNEQLLLRYGFVLDDNPADRLALPAGALAYALQASVESFQRALALNEAQDFLCEADAKKLAALQVVLRSLSRRLLRPVVHPL